MKTNDNISKLKAQQEANREKYLLQKYGAAELWRRQQESLSALEKLMPKNVPKRRV